jgi:hypothetical protein
MYIIQADADVGYITHFYSYLNDSAFVRIVPYP